MMEVGKSFDDFFRNGTRHAGGFFAYLADSVVVMLVTMQFVVLFAVLHQNRMDDIERSKQFNSAVDGNFVEFRQITQNFLNRKNVFIRRDPRANRRPNRGLFVTGLFEYCFNPMCVFHIYTRMRQRSSPTPQGRTLTEPDSMDGIILQLNCICQIEPCG